MNIIQDVTVVGCSIHPITPNYIICSFWLTDNNTGSTSMFLIEKKQFINLTNFHTISKKTEVSYKCVYCSNSKCMVKNSSSFDACLNKIFYSPRKYERVETNLKGLIKTNLQEYDSQDIIIKDISLGGIKCILTNQDVSLNVGENVYITLCTCGFTEECVCKKCFNLKTLLDTVLEGVVVWNIGTMYGIALDHTNKNSYKLNEILEKI
ncbi:PilZ domain-containing protein [Deferribacteraceae bacterium V6Fe1]|nr:PilZ domain-containing protein [Deferribacteraceae bacterium V6Fe1]